MRPRDSDRVELAIQEMLAKEPRTVDEIVRRLKREGLMDQQISSALVHLLSRRALKHVANRALALGERWEVPTGPSTPNPG